ncbi:MAG: riboflavin synthase [Chloroflexota bacterium]|nr:riboflavin synthase [Chloroflexota bacterium]
MFSGIVSPGTVTGREDDGAAHRLSIGAVALEGLVELGESVAVNGVCLTVAAHHDGRMTVDLMPETLRRSNLGQLVNGARVNVERSLRVGDRIGGHFVQGHIDGVAEVVGVRLEDEARVVHFRLGDTGLARYIVDKGFVSVDGISLTVVQALADGFSVSLVKTTLDLTTLGQARVGYVANIEVDLFARYLVDRPSAPNLAEVLATPTGT